MKTDKTALTILRKYKDKKHNPEDTFYSQKDALKAMEEYYLFRIGKPHLPRIK
jgi:hypothetical protein